MVIVNKYIISFRDIDERDEEYLFRAQKDIERACSFFTAFKEYCDYNNSQCFFKKVMGTKKNKKIKI